MINAFKYRIFSSLCLSIFLFGVFLLPVASADIVTDLVSRLRFDDNVASTDVSDDYSGDTWSSVSNTEDISVSGVDDLAFSFNGSTDYVVGTDLGLVSGYSSLTLSAWAKASSVLQQSIFIQRESPNIFTGLYFDGTSCGVFGALSMSDTVYETVSGDVSDCSLTSWHLYTLTWSDGDYITLYQDGVQFAQSSSVVSGSLFQLEQPWYIGGDDPGLGATFNGFIDDVRIYSRALSSYDVEELFTGTTPIVPTISATSTTIAVNNTTFALGIIIVLLFIIILGFMFNNINLKSKKYK